MNKKGFEEVLLDKASLDPKAIRGQEQLNIVRHGGAQSQGGTSGNAINAISEKNPKKSDYIEAALKQFGDPK